MLILFLVMISQASGMPDSMCFLSSPAKPNFASIILEQSAKETKRACEVACGDNAQCLSIAYNEPTCTLLGDTTDVSCQGGTTTTVYTKSDGCGDRTDITAELGTDPCAQEIFPENTNMNMAGVCAREHVIRGIDEAGARITIDNHSGNMLSYDSVRRMWKVYNRETQYTYWLVAVTCALPINTGSCGCGTLPQLDPGRFGIQGGINAYVGPEKTCEDAAQSMKFWNFDNSPSDDPGNYDPSANVPMHIECQAGIYLLNFNDNSDGWQITNVTCLP